MAQSPATVGAAQDRGELAVTVLDQLVDLARLVEFGNVRQGHNTRSRDTLYPGSWALRLVEEHSVSQHGPDAGTTGHVDGLMMRDRWPLYEMPG